MTPHAQSALSIPREPTRLYVGRPTAPVLDESTAVRNYLGYSAEQIEQAAEVGARDGDDLGSAAVEAVCKALIDLQQTDNAREQDLATLRAQLAAEQQEHTATWKLYLAEMRERNRLAGLHAALSAEMAQLGHTVVVEVPL